MRISDWSSDVCSSDLLALSPEVAFDGSRGSKPKGLIEVGKSGTLTIPLRPEGLRAAWIVDGQQRSLALARAQNSRVPVPIIGFVSSDLDRKSTRLNSSH